MKLTILALLGIGIPVHGWVAPFYVPRTTSPSNAILTADELNDMFHLDQAAAMIQENTKAGAAPYTSDDRQQLWKRNASPRWQRRDESLAPEKYSSDDRAQLWKNNDVLLWHRRDEGNMPKALSNEDRAELFHLTAPGMRGRDMDHEPYTDRDRDLLWHLEERGKALHDHTKSEVFSDQDRAKMWHLAEKRINEDPAFVGEDA